jgi:hypothetical protein
MLPTRKEDTETCNGKREADICCTQEMLEAPATGHMQPLFAVVHTCRRPRPRALQNASRSDRIRPQDTSWNSVQIPERRAGESHECLLISSFKFSEEYRRDVSSF